MKTRSTLLALSLLATLCTAPAFAQAPSLDAHVNLSVADRPLEDVIATLRARSGANIVILNPQDPANPGQVTEELGKRKVTLDLSDVAWRDALSLVAESVGLVVEQRQAGVLVVMQTPRFTYDIKNGDIVEVIKSIAAISGANIVIAPEVNGTLSVHFDGVPWREALDVVSKTRGYTVVEGNYGVLRVVDPKNLEKQLETAAEKHHKMQIEFMVRTAKEWADLVAGNPYPDEAKSDPARLVLVALKSSAKPGAEKALQAAIKGRETVRVFGKNAYMYYPDGQGESKVTPAVVEKHLGARGTARNWNTVLKLLALTQ